MTMDEATEDLAELLEAVRGGETVLITDHGAAVAELHPVAKRGGEVADDLDAIKVGTGLPPDLKRFPPGSISSGVLDALLEERREGW